MKIIRHDLPTEGVKIAGIHFKPGKEEEVDNALAKELVDRKGFKPFGPDDERAYELMKHESLEDTGAGEGTAEEVPDDDES
jgi:hypothetical protein